MRAITFSVSAVTNYHTLTHFNKINSLSHRFHGSEVWVLISWFLWSHLTGWNQALAGAAILIWDLGVSSKLPGCWQTSFPCGFRAKAPVFLETANSGSNSASRGCPSPSAVHKVAIWFFLQVSPEWVFLAFFVASFLPLARQTFCCF